MGATSIGCASVRPIHSTRVWPPARGAQDAGIEVGLCDKLFRHGVQVSAHMRSRLW